MSSREELKMEQSQEGDSQVNVRMGQRQGLVPRAGLMCPELVFRFRLSVSACYLGHGLAESKQNKT